MRHDIQPLTGILPLLDTPSKLRDVTRARAALDLNNATAATRIEIASAVTGAAEWEPYFLDRALFEARRREAAAADAYLVRAAVRGLSVPVLAAGEQAAMLLNNAKAAADYRRQLAARAKEPRTWSSGCGANELCGVASRDEYVAGETLRLELTTTQSDETPPYVEIYVDDALRAEGEVRDSRVFEVSDADRGCIAIEAAAGQLANAQRHAAAGQVSAAAIALVRAAIAIDRRDRRAGDRRERRRIRRGCRS